MKKLGKALGPCSLVALLWGCGAPAQYIPGTRVPESEENRNIVETVEQYRLAVERRDAPALLAMASKNYWEDGGTPTGADDYGYEGLKDVLSTRFQHAESIRYSMRYMNIGRQDTRAFVDVLIDASFTIKAERGPVRMDKKDQNRLVLEHDGKRWFFISGM
ncbi:MAG: hypothetical protein HY698_22190 [Deltaproteobacteria bacterium]|nr:hypothetical protein [Deltaproteobacteria bacterium]